MRRNRNSSSVDEGSHMLYSALSRIQVSRRRVIATSSIFILPLIHAVEERRLSSMTIPSAWELGVGRCETFSNSQKRGRWKAPIDDGLDGECCRSYRSHFGLKSVTFSRRPWGLLGVEARNRNGSKFDLGYCSAKGGEANKGCFGVHKKDCSGARRTRCRS
jgi:hypothetical protein